MSISNYLSISGEVLDAIKNNKPVVALESTIISHGMPYPKNVETAYNVEQIVRDAGAVPATIAILNGKITVGLSKEEIDYLGREGLKIPKVSRRDLPYILASKSDGSTTVATTMIGAERAGIKVFATGGIGGVHRGGQNSFDISADLDELGQTDVVVVCAGAKAILDLGLTLEYLETKGVPVLGYKTNTLPAFYSSDSPFEVDYKVDTPQQIAEIMKAKYSSNLKGGILIANPIPDEYSLNFGEMEKVILNAVAEADSKGIKGKNITPFLLDRIQQLTEGESLESNIMLVYNNARLAAEIAGEYAKL
jgi:pseudouridine-5'-phosphate glycosidase